MKRGVTAALLLILSLSLIAAENSEIMLFAGWRWLSHWDSVYPYGRHTPYCRPYAGVGVGTTLHPLVDGRRLFYGYYGDPWWGFGYGVSYSLTEPRHADPVMGDILWPLPGSAPLKLRDHDQERAWSQEISEFMGGLDTAAWLNAATNRPTISPETPP